mgnify:CR=1 FL=1
MKKIALIVGVAAISLPFSALAASPPLTSVYYYPSTTVPFEMEVQLNIEYCATANYPTRYYNGVPNIPAGEFIVYSGSTPVGYGGCSIEFVERYGCDARKLATSGIVGGDRQSKTYALRTGGGTIIIGNWYRNAKCRHIRKIK